ncbi:hypothetical protein J1779_11820 [Rahnella sp. FC061912-K]|uniref:hypothetical protein n=1 Tax=Rahnella rivi TaxID=2816249 RepID=UPI0006F30488|nr:hypothetical protein [Rahnella rivi]KQN49695.1 hypothetical protein ASE99_24435 [Serratia sp. Leaf51]MBU9830624.1 hypothetical protein [Rahnella rivi]
MKILDKKDDSISLELTHKEFNVIREMISAVLISCSPNEIPTLTGWNKEELLDFGILLSEIAEENNINL